MEKNIKIAALIVAHDRVDCFQKICERLDGRLWKKYVHIDLKSNVNEFQAVAGISVFSEKRFNVGWGEFSQVEAVLALLSRAYEDEENTHFYAMTGRDYILKEDEVISDRIRVATEGGNYMTVYPMPQTHKPLKRLVRRSHYPHTPPFQMLKQRFDRVWPRYRVQTLLKGFSPFAGDAMWLISRSNVAKILNFLKDNPWFVEAFRYSHCPDEMFFQTLFANLELKVDGGCPTSTRWDGVRKHPSLVTQEMYEEMSAGWHFAARKFDTFYPK